ncbi:flavin-containing monooxygenase [Actinoplanes sp. NPDC000266]
MEAVIVGAGAAGLASARELQRVGADFAVLDAAESLGQSWQRRYDVLKLFTPARDCALPGMALPCPSGSYPSKNDMARYLAAYAQRFAIAVRTRATVLRHETVAGMHVLETTAGPVTARNLIVATGTCHYPSLPDFAAKVTPAVHQVHSARYQRPSDLPAGPVLVVGAGATGADIAQQLAADRDTWLAGASTGHVPSSIVRNRLVRSGIYRLPVPGGAIGRTLVDRWGRHGGPLIWQKEQDLLDRGVRRVPKVVGTDRVGWPLLADGRTLRVAAIVWCTGFDERIPWLSRAVLDVEGRPRHRRGISTQARGLAYVGRRWQRAWNSGFLGGMAGDGKHVVRALLSC